MEDFEKFFDKIKIEMSNQTKVIITQMNEKIAPLIRELHELKSENTDLKEKISSLEKQKRKNNIIIYGMKEEENPSIDLIKVTIDKIKIDLDIKIDKRDIDNIYRLEKKDESKEKN